MKPGEDAQRPRLSDREIRAIMVGIVLAMFLGALDQTIVATALPTIGRDLGDAGKIPWVVTAYLIAATAVTPLYGKFSDIHGRRFALIVAVSTFLVGSLACALAPNMLWLIVARAVQGLGGGGLISLGQTIVADIVSPRERAKYQVYIAGVYLSASVIGPALGGAATQFLHWSAIFWANLPLGALALWLAYTTLARLPRYERPHKLDIPGAALMVAATVALLLALSWGGNLYRWGSFEIAGLIGLSALLWIAFALRLATAREPLVPLGVLGEPVVRMGVLAAAFGMGANIGLTIFMPIYFDAVWGLGPASAGLALLPLMVGTVAGASLCAQTLGRVKRYKRGPMAGVAVAVIGALALALFAGDLSFWAIEGLLVAISFGLGMILPLTTVTIQNAVAPHHVGTATGAMGFFRQLGGALMVAALGAIVFGALAGGDPEVIGALRAGRLEFDPERSAQAFAWAFAAVGAALACAFACIARMPELPLRGGPEPAAQKA